MDGQIPQVLVGAFFFSPAGVQESQVINNHIKHKPFISMESMAYMWLLYDIVRLYMIISYKPIAHWDAHPSARCCQ